jgi:hypothetical protein
MMLGVAEARDGTPNGFDSLVGTEAAGTEVGGDWAGGTDGARFGGVRLGEAGATKGTKGATNPETTGTTGACGTPADRSSIGFAGGANNDAGPVAEGVERNIDGPVTGAGGSTIFAVAEVCSAGGAGSLAASCRTMGMSGE